MVDVFKDYAGSQWPDYGSKPELAAGFRSVDSAYLVGKTFELHGCDGESVRLGDETLTAIEDPSDGYRSCLGDVVMGPAPSTGALSVMMNLGTVSVVEAPEVVGEYHTHQTAWSLVASDGHVWLTWGTNNDDDYYPSFMFNWNPRT